MLGCKSWRPLQKCSGDKMALTIAYASALKTFYFIGYFVCGNQLPIMG
jgi:hypothetical protein